MNKQSPVLVGGWYNGSTTHSIRPILKDTDKSSMDKEYRYRFYDNGELVEELRMNDYQCGAAQGKEPINESCLIQPLLHLR